MSILRFPILFESIKGEKNLYTLFDSGAKFSCINPEFLEGIANPEKLVTSRKFSTASDDHYIEVTEVVRLDFYINDILLSDEFFVVPGLSEEAIIGAGTFQKYRMKLNFEHERVEVKPPLNYLKGYRITEKEGLRRNESPYFVHSRRIKATFFTSKA